MKEYKSKSMWIRIHGGSDHHRSHLLSLFPSTIEQSDLKITENQIEVWLTYRARGANSHDITRHFRSCDGAVISVISNLTAV